MLKIKKGDYFNVYREGKSTVRMIALSNSPDSRYEGTGNYCDAISIDPYCYYLVDVDKEVDSVIGNILA